MRVGGLLGWSRAPGCLWWSISDSTCFNSRTEVCDLRVHHLVQTQVLDLLVIPVNPLFSKRFSTPSGFRLATVVDSVAFRSSIPNRVKQMEADFDRRRSCNW